MTPSPSVVDIVLERRRSALIASFNRPESKNALNGAIIDGLFAIAAHLRETKDIRVLVLRGAGGTYCSGGDIKDFARQVMSPDPKAGEVDPVATSNRRLGDLFLELDALPQVVVSVVEGAAFGGAMGFLAVSDWVIAADDAKFALSETTLGLVPAQIGPFVVRKIGLFQARRLALSGMRFGAAEAREAGLVDRLAAPGGVEPALVELLTTLGRAEPNAVAATKRIFNRAAPPVDPRLLDEAAEAFAKCLRGAGRAGAGAFAAKKPAPWIESYDG
jgi:isohexenylglutaconyl-CoA hydratase